MRKAIFAFFFAVTSLLGLMQPAQAADPSAAKIFSALQGTTTIDKGGAIHSQARSIYSLGGGQVSFTGKRVSLLAADPPSFSAGCSGISWHFGGFAFISMDEIRQLVQNISQASLGVAVDLAMQVLCPQCYAVMTKLREIANMMRNAAADSCKVARGIGTQLLKGMGISVPTERQSKCAAASADDNKVTGWLNGVASSLCRGLGDAEKSMTALGTSIMSNLTGTASATARKPDQALLAESGNLTYRALSALGYPDGFVKDTMLSLIGMTITHPIPGGDCKVPFKNLVGSAAPEGAPTISDKIITTDSSRTVTATSGNPKPTDATAPTPVNPPPGGADKGPTFCHAPPLLNGIKAVTNMLLCGPLPERNIKRFAMLYFKNDIAAVKATSFGLACVNAFSSNVTLGNDTPVYKHDDKSNPFLYTCRKEAGECMEPQMKPAGSLLSTDPTNGFDGLVWMVGSALYNGVENVKAGVALADDTKAILNGSNYPLYRLINMAAVYPQLAEELLAAHGSTIALQYAMDTMESVAAIGAQPAIDLKSIGGVSHEVVAQVREQVMQIVRAGQENKSQVLARLAEKRALVTTILEVNRALQAEVISKGMGGNADLAISLRRQTAAPVIPAP